MARAARFRNALVGCSDSQAGGVRGLDAVSERSIHPNSAPIAAAVATVAASQTPNGTRSIRAAMSIVLSASIREVLRNQLRLQPGCCFAPTHHKLPANA